MSGNGVAPRRLVLVVDDDADTTATWSILLPMWGFDVEVANDGNAALRAATARAPAAILLDIFMPGLNGYEVARRLRQADGPRPLLIALTGRVRPQDHLAAVEAGFDLLFPKPADPAEVRSALERHCHAPVPAQVS